MAYDVLSDDLYDKSPRRRRPNNGNSFFKPVYLHILLIIIVIAAVIFLVMYEFKPTKTQTGLVTIYGDSSINLNYKGNLTVGTQNFVFITKNLNFNQSSGDFGITNFTGRIYLDNKTNKFYIVGNCSTIKINNGAYAISNVNFTLISSSKTNLNLYVNSINLSVNNGNIKLDNSFNYNFNNASIQLKQFNMSLAYENAFTFYGSVKEFNLISDNNSLKINYVNPN